MIGYATRMARSSVVEPTSWAFGSITNTQVGTAIPAVTINASVVAAQPWPRPSRRTRRSSPRKKHGYEAR
jgi:hypothetical protein